MQTVSGTMVFTNTAKHSNPNVRYDKMEIYLDGKYHSTLKEINPLNGNQLRANIDGNIRTYTVTSGDRLTDVVNGLANSINQAPDLGITAVAYPDRIELRQDAGGISGAGHSYAVEVLQGSASNISITAWTASSNLIESSARAYEIISLEGNQAPGSGDVVRAVITTLTGTHVTNEVINNSNLTRVQMMDQLMAQINTNPQLTGSEGCEAVYRWYNNTNYPVNAYLRARTNSYEGVNLQVDFQVHSSTLIDTSFTDAFNDNLANLTARGMIYFSAGETTMQSQATIDTSGLSDGKNEIMVLAHEGNAIETQARITIPVIINNNTLLCNITAPENGSEILQINSFDVNATAGGGTITSLILYAEGKILAQTNTANLQVTVDSLKFGVGSLQLKAQAHNTLGETAFSESIEINILANYDGDQLEDTWEEEHFGSITNYTEQDDPDGDGASNGQEQSAGTEPTNANSVLKIGIERTATQGVYNITFPTLTSRLYQVEYNDLSLMSNTWNITTPTSFPGTDTIYFWVEDGTSAAGPITNDIRFYRVNTKKP